VKHLENIKIGYVANREAAPVKRRHKEHHWKRTSCLLYRPVLHFECCLGFIVAGPEAHWYAHLNEHGKNGTEW